MDNDLRTAFLAAIAGGDNRSAKILARQIRAQKLPPINLNIEHTEGVYSLAGKNYTQRGIKEYLHELQKEHNLLFYIIDNSPELSGFDFLQEYTTATKKIEAMVIS